MIFTSDHRLAGPGFMHVLCEKKLSLWFVPGSSCDSWNVLSIFTTSSSYFCASATPLLGRTLHHLLSIFLKPSEIWELNFFSSKAWSRYVWTSVQNYACVWWQCHVPVCLILVFCSVNYMHYIAFLTFKKFRCLKTYLTPSGAVPLYSNLSKFCCSFWCYDFSFIITVLSHTWLESICPPGNKTKL